MSLRGNIIAYVAMCQAEGISLQKGMNFRVRGKHSVILMSVRKGAPYQDQYEDEGRTIIYEGHDVPNFRGGSDPKSVDQPEFNPGGSPTENGKFHRAAQQYKAGVKGPDIVRVYEKIKAGIWADNGYFHLVDSWRAHDGKREVFRFKLEAASIENAGLAEDGADFVRPPDRLIPTHVKLEVWKRDQGKCVKCGEVTELHFDHILPFSKGGTSLNADNVQLLCIRHNLQKSSKIE